MGLDLESKSFIIHVFGDKVVRGLRFWSMPFVLILLRTIIQIEALRFEGVLDFQMGLSKRNFSMLEGEVKN